MTQRMIWIAFATYGPEDDVEPLIVAGTTKEKAEFALYEAIKECATEATDNPEEAIQHMELWIEEPAFEIPLTGEQVQ